MQNVFYAADLFCGAGGTSSGLLKAATLLKKKINLVAINHWELAISTHSQNYPGVKHYNSDLKDIDPLKVVPSGKLRLLVASPECTHFSKARGGKPMNKQSRASIKYVLRWVRALDVEDVLIENVPDFMGWGPLNPKTMLPVKERKGEYFYRFIRKLQDFGYTVDYRVLNAADYGDPTTRKRLFIIARKHKAIQWPEPSHHKEGGDMFGPRPRWRAAHEIIDWTVRGESIYSRKKPLSPNTMRRIMAGLMKFGGEAFVIGQQSGSVPRSVEEPIPTISTDGAISFVEPFLLTTNWAETNRSPARSIDEPVPTVMGRKNIGLVEPFIMAVNHGPDDQRSYSMESPMPTITSVDAWSLVEPFVVALEHVSANGSQVRSIDEPLQTVTSKARFGVVEPFLVEYHNGENSERRTRSVDVPLPTLDTSNRFGLVEPFVVKLNGTRDDQINGTSLSLEDPLPTVTGTHHLGLVEPFLVEYYGTGQTASVDEPMKTLTGRDRFGLCQPMVIERDGKKYLLDIRFRMLQPMELARAMSFPKGYQFTGTREQVVKQIGNSVPVELAAALCGTLLQ